jgi:hypothetical protein
MWNLLKAKTKEGCRGLLVALEAAAGPENLSPAQREHLSSCPDCQTTAEDIAATRNILQQAPPRVQPGPWFAPRVMAAIAARESDLRQSLEAWAAVPRLAARLTWLSALALLLATTWLYQLPKSTPRSANDSSVESLFDASQSSSPQDDVVLPLEKAQ